MKQLIIYITIIVLTSSCSPDKDNRLEYALRFAENNRGELEKVLDHYYDNPEKQAAARFLIENMPYHYGIKVGNRTPLNKYWPMPLKENPFTEKTC